MKSATPVRLWRSEALGDSNRDCPTNRRQVLDVTFGEDASRIRTGHSPQNFALLRPDGD